MAAAVCYLDRQVLSIVATDIKDEFGMTNLEYGAIISTFSFSYAVMYSLGGWFIDLIGARRGYAIIVAFWSLVSMLHAAARSVFHFQIFRFLLGVGEGGNYPASAKVASDWFPAKERATAVGIYNVGSSIGAMVAPPLVAFITFYWGWRQAFVVTGLTGFIWVALWFLLYRKPEEHERLSDEERMHVLEGREEELRTGGKISIRNLLAVREAWAFIGARFLAEHVWHFYVLWLPKYLREMRDFTLFEVGMTVWIPFLAADFGSVAGGWISSRRLAKGHAPIDTRKLIMLILACLMPVNIIAGMTTSSAVCIVMACVAMAAHNGWIVNLVTLGMDIFPSRVVATVTGFGGTGGALGVLIAAPIIGWIVDSTGSYVLVFILYSVMHLLATAWVYLILRKK